MVKRILFMGAILVAPLMMNGCSDKPASTTTTTKAAPPDDPKKAAILDTINKLTPDEKATAEKVKAMKPEVNGVPAGKSLSDIVDDYSKNKGSYNMSAIGWEAHSKKNGRYKVVLYYQDYKKQYQTAEWEYDPAASKVYPFDLENAKGFWSAGDDKDKSKDKGKK